MKCVFSILALAGTVMGHNFVTHFHINGVADPNCVRQAVSADPLLDLASNDMACNIVQGPGSTKCNIKYGDQIAFEWRVDRNIAPADYPLKDGTIPVGVTDDSHKGPCAVYMKKVDDAATAVGAGDGWFKVSDEGLTDGVFCTDRLRLANAPQPGMIPANIAPGDYLMRPEFLTLNNAGPDGARQPQFYAGCVQVNVAGTSGTVTPATVSIPGYVNIDTPGLIFDIWNSPNGRFSNYPMVGPAPLADTGAGAPAPAPPAPSTPSTPSTPSVPSVPSAPSAPSAPALPIPSLPATPAVPSKQPAATITPPQYAAPGPSTTLAPPQHPLPSSACNVKIVTQTTLITVTTTATEAPADSTDVPDDSESESESAGPEPTTAHHGHHGGAHGGRRPRL